jgi:DUF917 family protein
MDQFKVNNLNDYALGAAILGSGGGGDPAIMYSIIESLLVKKISLDIIKIDALDENDLIVPIAVVGSPLFFWECPLNRQIFTALYEAINRDYPCKNIVWMPAEIGGCNALTPILMALLHAGRILDADLIGRAFPKIQMCKPAVLELPVGKSYISGITGDVTYFDIANVFELEQSARLQCMAYGGAGLIATYIHNPKDASAFVLSGSMSQAMMLGKKLAQGTLNIKPFFSGKIIEVNNIMQGGFVEGTVQIVSKDENCKIFFQNEFLALCFQNKRFGSPDLIILIDKNTNKPLSVEALQYGLSVDVYIIKAPEFWYEPKSFAYVDHNLILSEAT